MNKLAKEEKELLELEQEKEYLMLQEELLRECQEEGKESCDTEISWASVTEKMSTLSVSLKKT